MKTYSKPQEPMIVAYARKHNTTRAAIAYALPESIVQKMVYAADNRDIVSRLKKAPLHKLPSNQAKKRRCLKCKAQFSSTGFGNRLCWSCGSRANGEAVYRDPAMINATHHV